MNDDFSVDRRRFLKTTAAVAGSAVLGTAASAQGDSATDALDHRNERSDRMPYRRLGRTNFMCSRLIFGCGAALAGGRADRLLEVAFESGVNFYDIGYEVRYKGSEKNLSGFMKRHREEIWVSSKAYARTYEYNKQRNALTVDGSREAARHWSKQLDTSLKNLDTDYVDAYYLMGVSNPDVIRSEELYNAFLSAKEAGKVGHYGFSSHDQAERCLDAATETGWFDIAMVGITPAGWYDYIGGSLMEGTAPLADLKPKLERVRASGIGLIGMKAARHLASKDVDTAAFDSLYNARLMGASMTPFQRSYAYVLENGLDVVNSDMQNFAHFQENLEAAKTSGTYFA